MITRTTETAFRILIDLASQEQTRVVSLSELHSRIGGSQTYLAKVTAALTRARIVRSNRGAQGGLALAKAPQEIRMIDVVTAIQGAPAPAFCETTVTLDPCSYHIAMADLYEAIVGSLSKRTLQDLLKKPCGSREKDQSYSECRMCQKV